MENIKDFYVRSSIFQMDKVAAFTFLFHSDKVWRYLELSDLFNVSTCSRFCARLTVSSVTADKMFENRCHFGRVKVGFSENMTLSLLRRIVLRVLNGSEGTLSVDMTSGRVVLDIGPILTHGADLFTPIQKQAMFSNSYIQQMAADIESAYKEIESFWSSGIRKIEESHPIEKHLEISSVDEYDDFCPRHPQPKAHRRGNSYFNSDIESFANEALAGSLSSIASIALSLEGFSDTCAEGMSGLGKKYDKDDDEFTRGGAELTFAQLSLGAFPNFNNTTSINDSKEESRTPSGIKRNVSFNI